MEEILIQRLSRNDKSFLKSQIDSYGELRGLYYSLHVYTNITQIRREYRFEDALNALDSDLLFHIKKQEFLCKYSETNWNGFDINIYFRLKLNPENESFARWLLNTPEVWNSKGDTIFVSSIEKHININAKFGLAAYVHSCIEEVGTELLSANGSRSWPDRTVNRLGVNWLYVAAAEDVQLVPHKEVVKTIQIAPGTLLCGQYLLEKRLGAGGMGQVWKAYDNELRKTIAIKILAEDCPDDLRDTIKAEALTLSRISHPNIITMRGFHSDCNVSFMVMDFVEGCSLEDIIRQKGKLTETEMRRWLEPIAQVIDFLHGEKYKIVHRDIKPTNIMIGKIPPNDTESAFLCDFGIATEKRNGQKKNGNVTMNAWGTEGYRAPEIKPGVEVTPAADVYSFAVTIYRCLTGEYPGNIHESSPVTEVYPPAKRGLCWESSDRPEECADLFDMPIFDDSTKVVTPPTNGIILPVKVIDEFTYMLGRMKKREELDTLSSLGKTIVYNGERTGWKVADTRAFINFFSSLELGTLDEIKMANAEDRRQQIVCWFINHNVDEEFDAATSAILRTIHASVTTSL